MFIGKKMQSPDESTRSHNFGKFINRDVTGYTIKRPVRVKKSSGFFLRLFILIEYLAIRNEGQSVNIPC